MSFNTCARHRRSWVGTRRILCGRTGSCSCGTRGLFSPWDGFSSLRGLERGSPGDKTWFDSGFPVVHECKNSFSVRADVDLLFGSVVSCVIVDVSGGINEERDVVDKDEFMG